MTAIDNTAKNVTREERAQLRADATRGGAKLVLRLLDALDAKDKALEYTDIRTLADGSPCWCERRDGKPPHEEDCDDFRNAWENGVWE